MNPWARAAVQGAACGLMFGLVVLIGGRLWRPQVAAAQAKQPAVADVVRARRFELVDAAGKGQAVLSFDQDGPSLALFDATGRGRVVLGFNRSGPVLTLYDALATGKGGAVLHFNQGGPRLLLWDGAGKERAALGTTGDGNPFLLLRDKAGMLRAALGATSLETVETAEVTMRPESSLVLFDKAGKVIWQAP